MTKLKKLHTAVLIRFEKLLRIDIYTRTYKVGGQRFCDYTIYVYKLINIQISYKMV